MGSLRTTVLVLFAAVLAAPLVSAGKKDYTEVTLVVTDKTQGTPVTKAAVTLHFIRGKNMFFKKDRAEWDVKTDSKGRVVVPFIPNGKLKVQVYAKGYQTYGEEFEITGEQQTIDVKLLPPQAQYSSHEPTTPSKKQ